jgi:hypothetical protein
VLFLGRHVCVKTPHQDPQLAVDPSTALNVCVLS